MSLILGGFGSQQLSYDQLCPKFALRGLFPVIPAIPAVGIHVHGDRFLQKVIFLVVAESQVVSLVSVVLVQSCS